MTPEIMESFHHAAILGGGFALGMVLSFVIFIFILVCDKGAKK